MKGISQTSNHKHRTSNYERQSLFTVHGSLCTCGRLWLLFLIAVTLFSTSCASRQAYYPSRQTSTVQQEQASPGKFTGVYHTVKKGETLWRISRTYGVDLETLQWVNDVDDVTDLRVGRVLFIPGVDRTLSVAPAEPGEDVPLTGMVDIIWPLRGKKTSGFGPRGKRHHDGVDIAAPTGTPVVAAAGGKVAYSGNGMRGYGRVVVIKHKNDLSTVYAHNSKLLVRMGDSVGQGQTIARVGQTGWATGPHLHFEVRRRGVPEDPMKFLPEL